MLPELEITEADELGYYIAFNELFTAFEISKKQAKNDDLIEVNFRFTDEDTDPNEAQLAANEYLQKNANQLLENLLSYLKQDEEYFMEFYGVYRETSYERMGFDGALRMHTDKSGFPAVQDAKDLLKYLSISSITISDEDEDGVAYIGFTGSCTWEEEHGFGAAFHKSKPLHVWDYDYGQNPSWAADDEGESFLTNGFIDFHCLEDLNKRKSRLAAESLLIQEADTSSYEAIFDWLVKHQMIYGYRNTAPQLTAKEKMVLLQEITTLTFHGNEIVNIPKSISLLTQLESLEFAYNKWEKIPVEIAMIPQLKHLKIFRNLFSEIPKELMSLTALETLGFFGNKLQSIPNEIAQLKALKSLELGSNELTSLPDTLVECQQLEKIIISNNAITKVPEVLFALPGLKHLDVGSNKLESLSTSIGEAKSLETLDLRFNKLRTLPDVLFGQMERLNRLRIDVNDFSLEDAKAMQERVPEGLDADFDSAISCIIDTLQRSGAMD